MRRKKWAMSLDEALKRRRFAGGHIDEDQP
jgi:hypothetical protein